jgi:Mn2+/Fe2+ NRAMP family transporter
MKEILIRIKRKILFLILVLLPILLSVISVIDIGSWATLVVASAKYGIKSQIFIWINWLFFALIADLNIQTANLTKKSFGDIIRERYGLKVSFIFFILIFIANQAAILQNLTALKLFNQLFNLPWRYLLIFELIFLIFLFLFVSLRKLKRIIILSIFFYLSIVITTFILKPNWLLLTFNSLFFPKNFLVFLNSDFLFTRLAVMGTSLSIWNFLLISTYYSQKKIDSHYLFHDRAMIYILTLIIGILSWLIAVNAHQVFYLKKISLENFSNIVLTVKPFLNDLGLIFIGWGLFSLSVIGLIIIPLVTASFFSQIFGFTDQLENIINRGKIFKIIFSLHLLIGFFLVYFLNLSLFKITLYADFINILIFPLFGYFLVKFFYNKKNLKSKYLFFVQYIIEFLFFCMALLGFISLVLKIF